ncbi:hypothetical protein AB4Y43_01315 [Paraburkholderia sp. BR10872]|uniref:hypothetical protein n=1 Tax=Paraburkholderia sp. BR10872 TaxID=3236989 RepID=UPI0034D390D2
MSLRAASNNTASASVNLTGKTASISSTSLLTGAAAGVYRATVDLITTAVGTAGTVTATITSNNGTMSPSQTTGALSLSATGELSATFTLYSAANQSINYSTTLAGATGSPQYAMRIRLEYLG